jgi:hypothetical protein
MFLLFRASPPCVFLHVSSSRHLPLCVFFSASGFTSPNYLSRFPLYSPCSDTFPTSFTPLFLVFSLSLSFWSSLSLSHLFCSSHCIFPPFVCSPPPLSLRLSFFVSHLFLLLSFFPSVSPPLCLYALMSDVQCTDYETMNEEEYIYYTYTLHKTLAFPPAKRL